MIVRVDLAAAQSTLLDPDDFGSFAVRLVGDGDLAAAFGGDVRFDGDDHVWLGTASVESIAGEARSGEWIQGFRQMLGAVERFGWYDPVEDAIKAHLERE